MGQIVFGYDQNPGGILVQPVDDPGPENAPDSSQIAAVVQKRIYQSAGIVSSPGMNDHPRGFIDYQQMRILVQDTQRKELGLHFQFLELWKNQRNVIARL